jgi:hypothetical protein
LRETALAALFTGLAIALTWPLGDVWNPGLPEADDAMFSVWRLAWIAHQLPIAPEQLFDANIFWPEKNTLTYSDAMLLPALIGLPMIRLGMHPVVVHNVLLLGAFVLAAYSASRLMRAFTESVPARVIAGTIFAFAPYCFAHITHFELLWTAFIPMALLALLRALEQPSAARGARLGAAVGLQGLCSLYYLVFLTIWLIPATLLARLHIRYSVSRQHVTAFVTALVTAAVLLSPYVVPYSRARQELGPRPLEEVSRYSATPADYFDVHSSNWLYSPPPKEAQEERSLFVGTIALALAVAAVVSLRTPSAGMLAALAIIAADLSFGVNGFSYNLIRRALPSSLQDFRAPARFGIFVLLPVALLAGLTTARLTASGVRRAWAVTAMLVAGLAVEYWSRTTIARELPLKPPQVYEWLAAEPQTVTLEMPVPAPDRMWFAEPVYQYMSIYHWQPLVNGYSGHASTEHMQMLELLREFPSEASMSYLRKRGVQLILLNERYFEHGDFDALLLVCQDQRWFSDARVFTDFRLKRIAACRVQSPGTGAGR